MLTTIVAGLALAVFVLGLLERATAPDRSAPSTPSASPVGDALAAVDLAALDPDVAYVSLAVAHTDLHDPVLGLLTNPEGRGRAWERRADVAYIRPNREAAGTTGAGLRRHGGASRTRARRPSWRLYFRDDDDSDTTGLPILGAFPTSPDRIVLRREPRGYPNVMGFAIARQAGALVPESQPVRVLLNGEGQGRYLAVEHIHPQGWGISHFEHQDFSMFVYRGGAQDPQSERRYQELSTWVDEAPAPLTMSAVTARVDLDNLLRHLFTFIFCSTKDWAQGAAVLDHTSDNPRWSWIHWDLDHSFRINESGTLDDRPGIRLLVDSDRPWERQDARARLFNRLRREDPDFRTHFVALVTELLNHRVNSRFLDELVSRYEHLLVPPVTRGLAAYFEQRPKTVRDELSTYFDVGTYHRVSVNPPARVRVLVDGYRKPGPYTGWHVAGSEIVVTIDGGGKDFSHWLVNGDSANERTLRYRVVDDATIIPVFSGS